MPRSQVLGRQRRARLRPADDHGELALATCLGHPDRYATIFSGSPGAGYRPPEMKPTPLPRTYLVAGTLEPSFLAYAARWATTLREAATDVSLVHRRFMFV